MNNDLKIVSIVSFREMENVSPNDVVNIIETIQQCYVGLIEENSSEEAFLVQELQDFIDGLRCSNENLEAYLDIIRERGGRI